MSGGSWEYQYQAVRRLGEQLTEEGDPLRRALGEHLLVCAEACRLIEWSDSGDSPPDGWREAVEEIVQ